MVEPTFDVDAYATQDGEVSSCSEENGNEAEEDEEAPCAGEDPKSHHHVYSSEGDEFTSSFFLGDLKIIAKEDNVVNYGKEYLR